MSEQKFHIVSSTWNHENDCSLLVRCFGAAFRIEYETGDFAAAPDVLKDYLQYARVLKANMTPSPATPSDDAHDSDGDGNEEEDSRSYEMAKEHLKIPFEPLMASLAPRLPDPMSTVLYHFLYPRTFLLRSFLSHDKKNILARPVDSVQTPIHLPGEPFDASIMSNMKPKLYSSLDVEIELPPTESYSDYDPRLDGPTRVLVDGGNTTCFFKPWYSVNESKPANGANALDLEAHDELHAAISRAEIPSNVRVRRLHGLVVDDEDKLPPEYRRGIQDSKRIVGILLTHIEPKHPASTDWREGPTLSRVAKRPDCTDERRHRWADEIEKLVAGLHENFMTWGRPTADDVLVDEDDNVWLASFGSFGRGGYETILEDLRGVYKMGS